MSRAHKGDAKHKAPMIHYPTRGSKNRIVADHSPLIVCVLPRVIVCLMHRATMHTQSFPDPSTGVQYTEYLSRLNVRLSEYCITIHFPAPCTSGNYIMYNQYIEGHIHIPTPSENSRITLTITPPLPPGGERYCRPLATPSTHC